MPKRDRGRNQTRPSLCRFLPIGFCMVLGSVSACIHLEEEAEEKTLNISVPSPILFLHGLGGKAGVWFESGFTDFLEAEGLRNGGVVRIGRNGEVEITGGMVRPEEGDFFQLEVSDSFQSLEKWTEEIGAMVSSVRGRTQAPQVVLVGFSAGGLAGRRYLVEKPENHGVAKLLTIATPHRGSELAQLALRLKEELRSTSTRSGGVGFIPAVLNDAVAELESRWGGPLDAPLVRELLPERINPALTELNQAPHPQNLEYACILAGGSSGFRDWEDFERDLGRIRNRDLLRSRLWEMLSTEALNGIAFFNGERASRGDGAVRVASQDLREVDFFRSHRELVRECSSVNSGHFGAKERYQTILESISSPARFLSARRISSGTGEILEVDFHDFFAGLTEVHARNPRTQRLLPVSRPAIYRWGEEAFGRVAIGPFDPLQISTVDILVHSLEQGHIYGKRILLGGESDLPPSLEPQNLEPVVLTFRGIEDIPLRKPSGEVWDLDLSAADLRVVLLVGQVEKFRSGVFRDIHGSIPLNTTVELEEDPRKVKITLELWDVDVLASEFLGEIVWNPGKLPRGPVVVRTATGIAVSLDIEGPEEERVEWDAEPFLVPAR